MSHQHIFLTRAQRFWAAILVVAAVTVLVLYITGAVEFNLTTFVLQFAAWVGGAAFWNVKLYMGWR